MLAASLAMQVATRKVLGASWDRLPVAELALNPGGPVLQWPNTKDKELKNRLLNKYSGYLGSLWKELSRKKKKGKLPRDAPEAPPLVAAPLHVALTLGT